MKKINFLIAVFLLSAGAVFGQSLQMYESDYYRIFSDLDDKTLGEITPVMDSYLTFFNKYLHFPIDTMESKLRIKLFKNKIGFNEYLESVIDQTSNSYVFLQYKDPSKNELVAYVQDNNGQMKRDLVHYGIIQLFKRFVPYPPLWLMNGFAVYFENSYYDEKKGTVVFKENYEWLPTLKKAIEDKKTIPIDKLLVIDTSEANANISIFYAQVWGLVDFMINSRYLDYNRLLWDSLSALAPSATQKENEAIVLSKVFKWVNKEAFVSDFMDYTVSTETFQELVLNGVKAYSSGRYNEAEKYFLKASTLEEKEEIPYYYLGLVNYARGDYSTAEQYYQTALQVSSDKDRVNFALAVNAFADDRIKDAEYYTKAIGNTEKNTYKDKLEELKTRISAKLKG